MRKHASSLNWPLHISDRGSCQIARSTVRLVSVEVIGQLPRGPGWTCTSNKHAKEDAVTCGDRVEPASPSPECPGCDVPGFKLGSFTAHRAQGMLVNRGCGTETYEDCWPQIGGRHDTALSFKASHANPQHCRIGIRCVSRGGAKRPVRRIRLLGWCWASHGPRYLFPDVEDTVL